MCFIFSTTMSEIFLILRKIQLTLSSMYIGPHVNCPSFLAYINRYRTAHRIGCVHLNFHGTRSGALQPFNET
jgi:hypothetical protein